MVALLMCCALLVQYGLGVDQLGSESSRGTLTPELMATWAVSSLLVSCVLFFYEPRSFKKKIGEALMSAVLGGVVGYAVHLAAERAWEEWTMMRMASECEVVSEAMARYRQDHGGELPGLIGSLVPKYLDRLPPKHKSCDPLWLDVAEDDWAIYTSCNFHRLPGHNAPLGDHDTQHRLIYKQSTHTWTWGSYSHFDPPSQELVLSSITEQVQF